MSSFDFFRPPMELDCIRDIRTIQRFLSKVEVDEEGRWIWKGAKNSKGYGTMRYKGHQIGAHRISYAIFRGPIPKHLTIHHLSTNGEVPNRLEVTPERLEVTTLGLNSSDGNNRRWASEVEELVPF